MKEIYLPTKLFKHLFLIFSFLLCALLANAQKTWSGAAGASWNVAGNWTPAGIPAATDAVTINAGATPVVTAAAVCASIQINNSTNNTTTSLAINASQTLTVGATGTGTVTIGSATVMGNGNVSTTSLIVSGNLVSGNINQLPATRPNGSGGSGNTNLTINSTGIVTVTGNVTGTTTSGASSTFGTASVIFTGTGTLNVTGTFTTSVFTPSTGIVNYNGTALQSINPLYTTYGTLKSNNPAGVTLGTGVTVTNLVIGDIVPSSILNDNGNQIIGNAAGAFNLNSGTFNIGIPATATSFPTLFTTGNITIANGTTVNYNSAQPQTIRAVNYGNLLNTNNGNRTFETAGTIGISGTFTPGGGTYTVGTSTVSFNGTVAQVIPALTFSFNNLIINNNAGISSIGSNITVNNSLALTNGVVTTGANRIIIPSGGSASRTNGWVNGNLQQFIPSGGLSDFHVGNATVYRPVRVNFSAGSTAGSLTVVQLGGFHPQIASSGLDNTTPKAITPYWNLTASGGLAGTYDATFNFVAGDVPGGANTNNFVIRRYNGSWATTINGIRTATSTQATGLTSFGDFAIGEYSGLPTVSTQPVNTAVCVGNNASFTSASTSTPAPTVEWQRSTDGGGTWFNIIATTDGGIYTNYTTNTLNIAAPGVSLSGYQYRSVYTNINGTVNSAAATLTVTQAPTITLLDYATSPFANITATPQSVTLMGTNAYTGGTFTSDAGLTINSGTGDIIPNTSTVGTHTVTYTIPAAGGCGQVTATTNVTITTAPTANISYTSYAFCITDNSTYPATLTGTGNYNNGGAGFYSVSPASGLLINAATGDITPNGIAGTYTVTYHIPAVGGFPASTSDVNVVITPTPTATITYPGGPFCSSDQIANSVTFSGTSGAYSGGVFSASPAGLVLDAGTGDFTPNGSTANTYTVTYTIPASGGCAAIPVSAAAFDIVAVATATISYNGGNPYCQAITTAQAVTLTGASGGSFSSTPAGLTIDAAGSITPSTSIAGDYDVVYTIPASGPCGIVQITTTVTISEIPTGTISYPLQPYCTSDPVKSVTLTGTGLYSGGTFSSTAGLSINASSGDITPATSIPNTYTVTYTTPNGCPVTFTTPVEIDGSPTAIISYAGTPFCITDNSSQPVTLNGTGTFTGGTYTSTAGLSIDAVNGDITPGTSTAGTYTVTYTIIPASANCAPITTTTSVTITPAVGVPTPIAIGSGTEPTCQLTNGTTTTTYTTTASDAGSYNWSLSNGAAGSINISTGVMTWADGFLGTVDIQVTANGCNGVSAQVIRPVNVTPTVASPVFTLGTTSIRCQSAEVVTYDATATNTTGITYSLDAASTGAGNSIVPTTGAVTFVAGWSGTSVITASAAGCNGPTTATHTVTITPTVGTPVFSLGATSTRCQGAGTVTYGGTATNTTGITYSLDATSTGAGNSIVPTTGAVTFVAGWSGTSVITASAAGCNGPTTAAHTVTVTPTVTINAFSPATSIRCQAAGTINPTTTANNSTGITYSLDATTAAFVGNSIDGSTGVVTYAAGWSGTTTITASAAGCNGPATTTHVVTTNATTVGGSLSPTLIPICSGGNTGTITLSGHTGSVLRWESSVNAGSTWSPIANTTTTYSTTLTQATLFRAVVQNGVGVCAIANSAPALVIIDAPFTPTVTAVNTPTCLGTPVTLTASGYTNSGLVIDGGDFQTANPPGWNGASANNNNVTANSPWGEANGPKVWNGVTYNSNPNKFMIANGTTGLPGNISGLTTPVFSLVGLSSAYLAFNQAYNLAAGAIAQIQISIDGGSTFTTLQTYTGSGSAPGVPFGTQTNFGADPKVFINLNTYLGMTNLKLQFLYTGSAGSNWAVDNIVVTNSTSNPTGVGVYNNVTYTWSPAANLSATNTQSVIFTPVASGSFTYNVTTTTSAAGCTGAAPGTITVVVNNPVSITTQPATSGFCVGGNSTITVVAAGTTPTYQWQVSTTGSAGPWTNLTNVAPYSGVTTATLTLTAAPITLSTNYYRVIVTGAAPCGFVNSNAVTLQYTNVWMGTTNSDWNTATNWSDGNIPSTSCATVYIPNRINQPTLNSAPAAVITNIIIDPGATVTVTNAIMKIAGTITNSGTFDVTNGTIELNGTAPQTIPANVFSTNTIKNLIISNGVTLSGTLALSGNLSFGSVSGKTFATGGFLTLTSSATNTAAVGQVINGNNITGAVTVERYFSAKRAWRYLSVPTGTTQTVHQAWQENMLQGSTTQTTPAGYGTQVTDALTPTAGNGFDYFSPAGPSMKKYDGLTNTYIGIASTFVPIATNEGWMTFVRGDRTAAGLYATPTPAVLRTKGPLFIGNQAAITVPASPQFKGIGNPYAAPLDMINISKTGVPDFFYVWDPNLTGIGFGAFQTFTKIGSDYYPTPGGGSYPSSATPYNYIQSGLAFFVQGGAGSGTVTFTESSKASAASNNLVFRPTGGIQESLIRTNLYAVESSGEAALLDGTLNLFGDYSNTVDELDARKMANVGENMAIKVDSQSLVVERKQAISQQDTIFLNMLKMKVKSYRFEFTGQKFDTLVTAFLEDSYLNTRLALNINGTTPYDFTVENIPGSWNPGRFRIVFKSLRPLPITFTSIKAYQKYNDIAVDWNIEKELAIKHYEVERSADGQQFTSATTVNARANDNSAVNYQWLDAAPAAGDNFYRIKSTDITGQIQYSNVVKVALARVAPQITVYPNPVVGDKIILHLINQPGGMYHLRLFNSLGQLLLVRQLQHEQSSRTETLPMKRRTHGTYHLEVIKPDKSKIDIKIVY